MKIIKIIDIFKNSNEEKLVEKLKQLERPKIDADMRDFAGFERMRQTWIKPGKTEQASNQIYYKILKKGEYVTQQNIDDIEKDPIFADIKDTKEFKKYINYLNRLKKSEVSQEDINKYKKNFEKFVMAGTMFLKDFKVYKDYFEFVLKNNWAITEKEAKHVGDSAERIILIFNDLTSSVHNIKEVLLSNLERFGVKDKYQLLKLAKEVQEWMYGKNSFYQKHAQKVFDKYKDVYTMILDCKKDKLQNYVGQLNLDDMTKSNICRVLDALACLSIEFYNKENKYSEKAFDIEKIFIT